MNNQPPTVDAVGRLAARLAEIAGADVQLERPKDAAHGDFATNVALRTAKTPDGRPASSAAELAATLASCRKSLPPRSPGRVSSTSDWRRVLSRRAR